MDTVNDRNFALPMGSYKFRVLEAEKTTSTSGGNPMIKCTLEFIDNPEVKVKINGQVTTRDPNGRRFYQNLVLIPKCLGFVNPFRSALALTPLTADDLATQEAGFYEGKTGFGVFKGKAEEMKNTETGELIVNPHTQKPEVSYTIELIKWQGVES